MRRGILGVLVGLLLIGTADAQGAVPGGAFVKDAAGDIWLVRENVRVRVPIHPAPADQVAAIPASDRWLVPDVVGWLTFGDRPEWAQAAPAGLTFSGSEVQATRPFDLADGAYTARWSIRLQPRNSSCFVGARVKRVEDQATAAVVISTTLNQQAGLTASGETQLYGVKAGRYYLDVDTTGCEWSVTLTPSV